MAFEEQLVNGRYRLLGHIGRGAMSVVWEARDERLDRVVAVKQFLQEPTSDVARVAEACERAIREARLASRLRHPHAVTVHDVVEDAGTMYLVMEHLPARSLTELLVERGPLPRCDVARIGRQVAAALAAAHADWILHQDVTPNNVLVTGDGTAKITDFGVSRALGDHPGGDGVVRGTLPYLAPEIARGGEAGLPSDVYALGATLYTAVAGEPPFGTSDDPITLLRRITEDQLRPPARGGPLTPVLMRMLDRDPAARPSMHEVVELLATTGPAGVPATVPRRRSRLRRAAVGGVAAGVLAVGVVAVLARSDRPDTAAAPVEQPRTTVTTDHTVRATTTAPAPAPARVSSPPPAAAAVPAPAAGCTARYEVTTTWPGGAQAQVTVHNDRTARLGGWVVTWRLPHGTDVQNLWNGTLTRSGSTLTVTDAGWNALVEAGASTSFGLNEIVTAGGGGVPALSCRPN